MADGMATINRALGSILLWVGLGVGFPAGIVFQNMRSAWRGHNAVKKSLPGLRRAAWLGVWSFSKTVAVIVAIVFISLLWWGGWKLGNITPATLLPAPSSTPSPSHR